MWWLVRILKKNFEEGTSFEKSFPLRMTHRVERHNAFVEGRNESGSITSTCDFFCYSGITIASRIWNDHAMLLFVIDFLETFQKCASKCPAGFPARLPAELPAGVHFLAVKIHTWLQSWCFQFDDSNNWTIVWWFDCLRIWYRTSEPYRRGHEIARSELIRIEMVARSISVWTMFVKFQLIWYKNTEWYLTSINFIHKINQCT